MFGIKRFVSFAIILGASALGASAAPAATVIATLSSYGTGDSLTLHAVRPNGTPMAQQVLTGIANFNRTGGTETATLVGSNVPGNFYGFCIEPFESISLAGSYAFDVSPLSGGANSSIPGGIGSAAAGKISTLFGQFAPNLAAPMTVLQTSALQVALWEIVSELSSNPLDVFAGNTYFSTPGSANATDIMNLAQTYVSYVNSAGPNAPQAQGLQALTVNGNQDFLVQVVSTAPEPGTWLMMLLGFGLVGYTMRNRRGMVSPDAARLPKAVFNR